MFREEKQKVSGQRELMFGADRDMAEKVESAYKEI